VLDIGEAHAAMDLCMVRGILPPSDDSSKFTAVVGVIMLRALSSIMYAGGALLVLSYKFRHSEIVGLRGDMHITCEGLRPQGPSVRVSV
jgi:hypothetical protein